MLLTPIAAILVHLAGVLVAIALGFWLQSECAKQLFQFGSGQASARMRFMPNGSFMLK